MSNRPKSIWYVNPYGGGPDVGRLMRPWHLAKNWRAQGSEATVFVARTHHLLNVKPPLPDRFVVQGVPYVGLEARPYKGNGIGRLLNMLDTCRSLWSMRKRVGKDLERPDLIIVSSPHPFTIFPAFFLARRFKAKLVFEVRDLWPLSITEINGTKWWHPFVFFVALTERFAYRKADLVASLLPGVESYMRERGLTYNSFACIPNGFETVKTEGRKPVAGEGQKALEAIALWRQRNMKVIVHPGAMGPPNGLDRLLEALVIYNSKPAHVPIGVLLLGDGISRSALQSQIQELKLDMVLIAGPVSKAETSYIVSKCDFGYCGGKTHDAVYRYGISLNKMIDFGEQAMPMLLPFDAMLNEAFAACPLIIKCTGTAEGVSLGLEQLVQTRPDSAAAQRLSKELSYSLLAQKYLDAVYPKS